MKQLQRNHSAHGQAIAWLRLAIGNEPDLRLFKHDTGTAQRERKDGTLAHVRYGLVKKGGSDTIGILRPLGRWVAIEIKIADDPLTDEQQHFIALIRTFGGFATHLRFPYGTTEQDVTRAAQTVLARARVKGSDGRWVHYE